MDVLSIIYCIVYSIICGALGYFYAKNEKPIEPKPAEPEPIEFRPKNFYGEYGNVKKINFLVEVDKVKIYTTEVFTQSGCTLNDNHPWVYSKDITNLDGIPVYIIKDEKGREHKIVKCEESKILNLGLVVLKQRLLMSTVLGFDLPHANAYIYSRKTVKFSCMSRYDEKIINENITMLENIYHNTLLNAKIKAHNA
jgi:hypothetical protein